MEPKTGKISNKIYKVFEQMKEKKIIQKAGTIVVKTSTLSNEREMNKEIQWSLEKFIGCIKSP